MSGSARTSAGRPPDGRTGTSPAIIAGSGSEPRAGSSLYYALLGVESRARRRFLDRAGFGRTLTDVLLDVRESDVARRKIHWWHEELERLYAGEPRHPEAVRCVDLAGNDEARALALEILGAAADERLAPARTVSSLDASLARVGMARLRLLADALSTDVRPSSDDMPDFEALAIGLMRHERLARLPALLVRGHPVFSDELYRRHGLASGDLAARVRRANDTGPVRDARIDDLLQEAVGLASEALATGLSTLANQRPSAASAAQALRPMAALAQLRRKQLDLWRRRRPDLVREYLSLTPIRKFWIASRAR